jgi:hypothetical protein
VANWPVTQFYPQKRTQNPQNHLKFTKNHIFFTKNPQNLVDTFFCKSGQKVAIWPEIFKILPKIFFSGQKKWPVNKKWPKSGQ